MILFLHGPDTYRSRKKLKEIIERYRELHKNSISFHIFDSEAHGFNEFRDAAEPAAMFGGKRFVVLKHFLASGDFCKSLLSWGRKKYIVVAEDPICVFYEGEIDKKAEIFNWFLRNSKNQEFKILTGADLYKWAGEFVKEEGIKISKPALLNLLAKTAGNLWAFDNEIKKLSYYKGRGSIECEDLDVFLRAKEEAGIFSLVDAFVENNKSKAFILLKSHIEAGDNANYLFSMVYNQFRNIAQVLDSKSGAPGMHPYVLKKSLAQARQFNRDRIKKTYRKLVDLDMGIKTGKVEPVAALEELILAS